MECVCVAFANPVFVTELFVDEYSLDDAFLLIGLCETGVVCGPYAYATYARSNALSEATT